MIFQRVVVGPKGQWQPVRETMGSVHLVRHVVHLCLPQMSPGPGVHFTGDFPIVIQIRWKFHSNLMPVVVKWSLRNVAHGTTAVLSWHVRNFVAIPYLSVYLHENQFPSNLNNDGKMVRKMGPWIRLFPGMCCNSGNMNPALTMQPVVPRPSFWSLLICCYCLRDTHAVAIEFPEH